MNKIRIALFFVLIALIIDVTSYFYFNTNVLPFTSQAAATLLGDQQGVPAGHTGISTPMPTFCVYDGNSGYSLVGPAGCVAPLGDGVMSFQGSPIYYGFYSQPNMGFAYINLNRAPGDTSGTYAISRDMPLAVFSVHPSGSNQGMTKTVWGRQTSDVNGYHWALWVVDTGTPVSVAAGTSVAVEWSVQGNTTYDLVGHINGSCAISIFGVDIGCVNGAGANPQAFTVAFASWAALNGGGVALSGSTVITPSVSTTETLNGDGPDMGEYQTDADGNFIGYPVTPGSGWGISIPITVAPAVPTLSIYADANVVWPNSSVGIHWRTTSESNCTVYAGDQGAVFAQAVNGDQATWALQADTTFTLQCADGNTVSTRVFVQPIGDQNVATCSVIHGVDIYYNGPAGTGTGYGRFPANQSRPDVPAAGYCNGNAAVGFSIPTPSILKDGNPHSVYVYAINGVGDPYNPVLFSGPQTVQCGSTCPLGQSLVNGVCVPTTCPAGQTLVNGVCVPNTCPAGQTLVNGVCTVVTLCPIHSTGTVPNCVCDPGYVNAGGSGATLVCTLVPVCPANSVGTYPDCTCAAGYESNGSGAALVCTRIPAGSITSFAATPTRVRSGETTSLAWSTANMASCRISNTEGVVVSSLTNSGGLQQQITHAEVYTLSCTGRDSKTYTARTTAGLIPNVIEL
jgi:hypothetical protein